MADRKISQEPPTSTLTLLDYFLINQAAGPTTARITVNDVINYLFANAPGTGGSSGWSSLAILPTTITYNGQRSYTLTFSSGYYNNILVPGVRIRTSRNVMAPTQCASLNGTSQYWLKSSPNKLTFTNNFVIDAYIKLTSYAAGEIVSRFNGTSGWTFDVQAGGQLRLTGFNGGAGNTSYVQSIQSLPLNRWIRVTAQLDMATYTATPTTSYVMLDGVDVPAAVFRAGTNPTALVQAGDLEVGATNGASVFFSGSIAQVAIHNTKVSQATMLTYMSQSYSGSEPTIASAYSFNGTATDLNTTTPNNLTAQSSAGYVSDSPFTNDSVVSIAGVNGITDFSIVQNVTSTGAGAIVVVQVPVGCAIPTTGGLSSIAYSGLKAPFAFPTQKDKWSILSVYKAQYNSGSVGANVVTNVGNTQINLPIGSFAVDYNFYALITHAGMGYLKQVLGLSTANNAMTDSDLICNGNTVSISVAEIDSSFIRSKDISLSAATIYYMNSTSSTASTTQYFAPSSNSNIIRAVNSLL